jgi:hypothetical protein
VRLLVLLTLAAMASAASTTLAPIPGAARGYIAGALLLPAARWMLHGDRDYVVVALLAVSMAFFLAYSARITHEAFLEGIGRARQLEALSGRIRDERAEWLDLSHATEAFVLLDDSNSILLWNGRFQELVQPTTVERGLDYISAFVKPRGRTGAFSAPRRGRVPALRVSIGRAARHERARDVIRRLAWHLSSLPSAPRFPPRLATSTAWADRDANFVHVPESESDATKGCAKDDRCPAGGCQKLSRALTRSRLTGAAARSS